MKIYEPIIIILQVAILLLLLTIEVTLLINA